MPTCLRAWGLKCWAPVNCPGTNCHIVRSAAPAADPEEHAPIAPEGD